MNATTQSGKQGPFYTRPLFAAAAVVALLAVAGAIYVGQPKGTIATAQTTTAAGSTAGAEAGQQIFTTSGSIPFATSETTNVITPDPQGKFVTLSSTVVDPRAGTTTGGAYVTLDSAMEALASGKTVTVVISARSSATNGSPALQASYSTDSVGNSGWRVLPLTSEFSDVSFTFMVPPMTGSPGQDYLGIVADPEAKGRSVDVEAITIYAK